MKYLKQYKIFESNISKQDITEMCYDLTDRGFQINFRNVAVTSDIEYSVKETCITIDKVVGTFILDDEIVDIILRIADYAGDRFDDVGVLLDWPSRQWIRYFKEIPKKYNHLLYSPGQKIKLLSQLSSGDRVTAVNIYIKTHFN